MKKISIRKSAAFIDERARVYQYLKKCAEKGEQTPTALDIENILKKYGKEYYARMFASLEEDGYIVIYRGGPKRSFCAFGIVETGLVTKPKQYAEKKINRAIQEIMKTPVHEMVKNRQDQESDFPIDGKAYGDDSFIVMLTSQSEWFEDHPTLKAAYDDKLKRGITPRFFKHRWEWSVKDRPLVEGRF